jgi:hypothetical protein
VVRAWRGNARGNHVAVPDGLDLLEFVLLGRSDQGVKSTTSANRIEAESN